MTDTTDQQAVTVAQIPEGMKPWAGGVSAPDDWNGGPVYLDWGHGEFETYTDEPQYLTWKHDPVAGDNQANIIAYTPEPLPATNQAGEVEWCGMEDAPRDGSIIELRSALRLNRSVFRAAYVRPRGLVAKAWVPVRGQSVGDFPWKDHEVEAWRPSLATQPATSQEGQGTFACPICGKDTPHYHAPEKSVEPIQCPECGVGRLGHESGCSRATVLTIRPRGPFVSTQPATSQERDDADRANGVGQDELVAGLKRALQHPAGDHDGWTDAGMEDAFFRWPVIVNALNEALLATQPATSQEGEDGEPNHLHESLGDMVASKLGVSGGGADYWRIRAAVVRAIENSLAATPTPPTLSEDLREEIKRISADAAASRVRWLQIIANGGATVNGVFIEPDEAHIAIGVLDWIGPRLSAALARAALAQVKAS